MLNAALSLLVTPSVLPHTAVAVVVCFGSLSVHELCVACVYMCTSMRMVCMVCRMRAAAIERQLPWRSTWQSFYILQVGAMASWTWQLLLILLQCGSLTFARQST